MIQNRDALLGDAHDPELARLALDCVEAGIQAADPERATRERVRVADGRLCVADAEYDLADYDRVVVLGGGKATAGVTRALENALGDRLDESVVAVPGDADPGLDRVEAVVAGHPTPTDRSIEAGERVLTAARDAGERTLVLAVVTGGGSALLAAPAGDLALDDLRGVTDALLAAGADIDEMNAVRKHVSALKGGRLARAAAPATVVGLLVSDVVGDDPAVIASGPTAPDASTHRGALDVLDRYDVDAPAVRAHLEAGTRGEYPETPTADEPPFADGLATNYLLAGGRTALDAARERAREAGYEPLVLSSRVRGEATEAALTGVAVAEEALTTGDPVEPPAVVLSGGETTVTVRGEGTGGPNGEYALRTALEVSGTDTAVALACVDTDGRDGSADAAGALVDPGTVDDRGVARDALARNDSHGYLGEREALIQTGPTGTNVNDLRVFVVGRVS
ncbi:MAG: glycerate kinase [Halobacteriaceae archaeon]